jgi:predicted transcriptional regulator
LYFLKRDGLSIKDKDNMDLKITITSDIAECVGLWLAEGDNKTIREITFTNNCPVLVKFFGKTIQSIFKNFQFNPRIYIYSKRKEKVKFNLNCQINHYTDNRATKPYFIYRIASTKLVVLWRDLVNQVKNNKKFYNYILKGFFAGEGNLKAGIHSHRTIRIAQGKPNKLIENIFKYYGIKSNYKNKERAYYISGKWNWDILAKIKIANLHPIKKKKFWKMYRDFKEIHYPNHYLRENILKILNKPYTSLDLSKKFNRSQARIYDILSILKRDGKAQKFYVRSKVYWILKNQNKIIISHIKEKYLSLLKVGRKTTGEISKEIGVCWKAAYRRLLELQKLDLVVRDSKGMWNIVITKKEVVVL